jgi:hypothetical protein
MGPRSNEASPGGLGDTPQERLLKWSSSSIRRPERSETRGVCGHTPRKALYYSLQDASRALTVAA